MRESPHMRSTGPSTPPLKTAPASHRQSPAPRRARSAPLGASSNASADAGAEVQQAREQPGIDAAKQ
jgi:hypothetical protein